MTTSDRHRLVKRLFDDACDLREEERVHYLARECGDDEDLRAEVEALLAFEAEENGVLSASHRGAGPRLLAEHLARGEEPDEHPTHVGSYQIKGVLGRGGMGTVYEAEQENPRRRVALKVIRSAFVSRDLLKRFWHEAQLLGQLDHPGIARILEAGSAAIGESTWPFIAMERIEGDPIDRHVRERHMSHRDVMELVARVCDAVEHAHQRGIVHRDLKPANILVETKETSATDATAFDTIGQPKVLDFGVARITDGDLQVTTIHTHVGQIVGTLSYMSPEQVAGRRDLDARCDVYALGILLYELLSGRRPYDLSGRPMAEAARIITETDPSALVSIVPGMNNEVSTIVAKALEKEPERRYASAGQLGLDLRRYLANEPILARSPSALYRIRKFARRNRVLVGGVTATGLALVLGLVGTTRALVEAQAERDAKTRALDVSNAVTGFLSDMLIAASPTEQGKDVTVREVMDQAAGDIGGRVASPLVEAELRKVIGFTYTSLSEYAKADSQLTAALQLWTENLEDPNDVRFLEGYQLSGQVAYFKGEYDRALDAFTKALAIAETRTPPDDEAMITTGANIAFLQMQQGRYGVARKAFEQVIEAAGRALSPDDPYRIDLEGNLAMLMLRTGDYANAAELYRSVIEDSRRVRGEEHPQTILFRSNLATSLLRLGRNEEAKEILTDVYATQQRVLGAAHSQTLITLGNLGRALNRLGQSETALHLLEDGLDQSLEAYGEASPSTVYLQSSLVKIRLDLGNTAKALEIAKRNLDVSREALGSESDPTATAWEDYVLALLEAGDLEEAAGEAQRFIDTTTAHYGADHDRVRRGRLKLADAYSRLERTSEAERELLTAFELSDSLETGEVAEKLIALYEQTGNGPKAEEWRERLGN